MSSYTIATTKKISRAKFIIINRFLNHTGTVYCTVQWRDAVTLLTTITDLSLLEQVDLTVLRIRIILIRIRIQDVKKFVTDPDPG